MKDILLQVLGTTDLHLFITNVFFAALGMILSLLWSANKRDVNSEHSPLQFSWGYLLCDNAKRLLGGAICVFIALRFSEQLTGAKLTPFLALGVGLGMDNLAKLIQNKLSGKNDTAA